MKLIHRYKLGVPLQCDAKFGTGALIALGVGTAVAGIAGTAMTNSSNYNAAMTGISASKEENQLNRDYNTAEAEKARNFSANQAQIQRDYDQQKMQQQFDMSRSLTEYVTKNQYDWQRQGASNAGFNPNVAFGNGMQQVSASPAPAGTSTSAPSASPASYSMGLNPAFHQYQNPFASLPSAFQSMASGLNQLAEAKKAGVDTSYMEQMVKNAALDEQSKKVLIEGYKISNDLQKLDLKYRDRKLLNELEEQVAKIATAKSETELNNAYTRVQAGIERLNEALTKYHGQHAELVRAEVQAYPVQVQEMKASIQEKLASANKLKEEANSIQQLRGWQVGFQQALTEIKQTESFVQRNTLWEQCEAKLAELRAAKMLPDQVDQALREAKKRNDWFELNQILGIVDTGVRAAGTYYGAKTGQGFVDAQNVSNSIKREYNAFEKQKYDDTRREKIRQVTGSGHYWGQDY